MLTCCQASEVIEDLEQMVARLKQQLRDSEHQRQKQLRVNAHDTLVYFIYYYPLTLIKSMRQKELK